MMIDPDQAFLIPLKLKYREAFKGKFSTKHSNSGKKQLPTQGNGHRRRAYGPFDTFSLDTKSKTK